jgi:hypothetical protein
VNKKSLNHIERRQVVVFLLCLVMALAIFVRVLSLYNSDNFHGIAAGKVFSAQKLIKHPFQLDSWIIPAHGPIHIYMVALVLKLFGNPLFAPRLISLFMSIAFMTVYYNFVKNLFDEKTALLSSFLVALFPLHIIHSVISTAEMTFLFFLFLGLFYIEKYFKNQELSDLVKSALFISISSMCRFEGGLFILLTGIFLLKQPKRMFLFYGIAAVLPVIWMICNYIYGGNFLFFLAASDSIVNTEFEYLRHIGRKVTFLTKLFYWPLQIVDYFGWPIAVTGFLGVIFWGRSYNKRVLSLFLIILAFFVFKTVKEELAMQPRYGLSIAVLFLPFFAIAFFKLINKIRPEKKQIITGLLVLYILIRSTYFTAVLLPHTPFWLKQAGAFLHKNLGQDEVVFVDADEDNFKEPLKLQANIDRDRFIDQNHFFRHIELLDPSQRKKLKYIVLISERNMHNLNQVFKAGDCKIYDVSK